MASMTHNAVWHIPHTARGRAIAPVLCSLIPRFACFTGLVVRWFPAPINPCRQTVYPRGSRPHWAGTKNGNRSGMGILQGTEGWCNPPALRAEGALVGL